MNAEGMTNLMEGAWGSDGRSGSGSGVGLSTIRTGSGIALTELRGVGLDCLGIRNKILLIAQSINGLYQASQLCPKTIVQEPSNGVTYNVIGVTTPDGKWMGRLMV